MLIPSSSFENGQIFFYWTIESSPSFRETTLTYLSSPKCTANTAPVCHCVGAKFSARISTTSSIFGNSFLHAVLTLLVIHLNNWTTTFSKNIVLSGEHVASEKANKMILNNSVQVAKLLVFRSRNVTELLLLRHL